MTDNLTWYGGGTDDYVQDRGAPIAGAVIDVWDAAAPGTGTHLTDLRQYDGSGVLQTVTQVTADLKGYYRFAVNNHDSAVFLDPGIAGLGFRFQVDPNNVPDRLAVLEAAIAAAPSAPTDHGLWTAGVSMLRGDYFTSPTTGERRTVAVAYTTPATYNLAGLDLAKTIATSSGSSAAALTPTGVQTADYSAAAGDFIPVDATAANINVTLPTAPADRSQVSVKLIATASGHTATIATTGGVKFNNAGGSTTSLTLTLPNQVVTLQWSTSAGLWYVLGDSYPLSQLDARFAGIGWSQAAADARYAPLGAFFKEIAIWNGDLLFAGLDADINGVDMIAAGNIHQLDCVLDLPPESTAGIVDVYKLTVPGNVETLIGTVTVPAGTCHGQTTFTGVGTGATPDPAFADGDKIFGRLRQVGATWAPGSGLKLRMSLGGRVFPTVPTPGVPTGLAIIATDSSSATLQWANGANSSQGLLYRSDSNGNMVPYWNIGSQTTFVDRGPDGSGLAAGENHTYAIKGRRASELSALSATVAGGPVAYSSWLANDSSIDGTAAQVTVGTGGSAGIGTSLTTQNGSPATLIKGGNSGSNNALTDRVLIKGLLPAGTHLGYAVNMLLSPLNTSSIWNLDVACGDQNLTTLTTTNYVSFQGTIQLLRFGAKFGAWVPTSTTGQGTTAGSFQNISDPAYPVNLLGSTARTSTGGLNLPSSQSLTSKYGYRFEAQPVSAGQQVYVVRYGTEAQYGVKGVTASTMPVLATMTVTADRQASRLPGYVFFTVQGAGAAGGTQYGTYLYDFRVAALTPNGV